MPSAFDTMMMNGANRQRRRQYNGNRYNETGSIDDQIAQDFTKLSFHDRNAIYEEIHGVHNPAPDETPEMLANALHQLSLEIAAIPHKPAFDKSQQWNSLCNSFPTIDCTQSIYSYNKTTIAAGTHTTYVNTVDFRLRFLRCELFDAKKAAIRIVNYLEMIHDLYGGDEELLRRPIGLIDLKTREERDCLRSGFHQLLPFRDRSGRRVLAIVPNMDRKNFCIRLRSKVFLYIWSVAADNEETQKRGVVAVCWPQISENNKENSRYTPPLAAAACWNQFIRTIPIRIIAIHICKGTAGPFLKIAMGYLASLAIGTRIRIKIHTGDRTNIQYSLMGYGIPVDLLPLTDTGNIKTKNLLQWIKVRKALDESIAKDHNGIISHARASGWIDSNNIECPGLNDVIFRSGKNHMSHPGNASFQSLIEARHEEHSQSHQDDKALITWWIVEQVELKGGNFLEWNSEGMWSQILDRALIRSKVSSCFRTYRRKLSAMKHTQTSESFTSEFMLETGSKRKRATDEAFCDCDKSPPCLSS